MFSLNARALLGIRAEALRAPPVSANAPIDRVTWRLLKHWHFSDTLQSPNSPANQPLTGTKTQLLGAAMVLLYGDGPGRAASRGFRTPGGPSPLQVHSK